MSQVRLGSITPMSRGRLRRLRMGQIVGHGTSIYGYEYKKIRGLTACPRHQRP
jgi:hypothetical protein